MISITPMVLGALLQGAGQASSSEPKPDLRAAAPGKGDARTAIDRGVQFLVKEQNPDGSWGGPRNKMMTDSFANSETYTAWTVATTGLVCTALIELAHTSDAAAALDKGLDFLCAHADVKRPADWDTDNTWGMVYGLQGIAKALAHEKIKGKPREAALRKAGQTILDSLKKYQSDRGGWGYYAQSSSAYITASETSFMTAAGVIALCDAKDVGLSVDPKMLARAVASVEHCRLPNGAFTYSTSPISEIRSFESINDVKGSLGRIQVCNLALLRAGGKVSKEQISWGLDQFFEHHKFLDVGRMKPIPHEAYYQIAGYFYFFGHYYAGRLLEQLPATERAKYASRLQKEILKTIEADGSMWDFYIANNTRPYGTAFGILTLGATLTSG